jgi:hypothetical protein
MRSVIVAGALANKPGNGGEAWVRLSWMLGLRRLGLEVWFVEQIDSGTCRDDAGAPTPIERSVNLRWFESVVSSFELQDRAVLLADDGSSVCGPDADALLDAAGGCDAIFNISGNVTLEAVRDRPRIRVYVDLDPGYTQLWDLTGALGDTLDRHEHLLTVGLAIGAPDCEIPVAGRRWRPVPPPVVLDEWAVSDVDPQSDRATTVGAWRGGYGRAACGGRLYGQKAHEFRRFAAVPRDCGVTFEAALAIDPADAADAELLRSGGWRLVDPHAVAATPDAFREYVRGSACEFSPAQGIYVDARTGWLSDRTTRYLACGRPAIVQDTGSIGAIPRGEGLLGFATPDGAVRAVENAFGDYGAHAKAARRLTEQFLDSDVVLGRLLEDLL